MTPAELLAQLVNGYVEVTTDERMVVMRSDGSRTELLDQVVLEQLIEDGLVVDRGNRRYRATPEGVTRVRDQQTGS